GDPVAGAGVLQEVLTIVGPTPDPEFIATHPNAVREWCINTAVVDPATDSVLANSEDGKLYRWNLTSNTFTQQMTLTSGAGEAYTPDRKSTRLNSSHLVISYAVFCLKKKRH